MMTNDIGMNPCPHGASIPVIDKITSKFSSNTKALGY